MVKPLYYAALFRKFCFLLLFTLCSPSYGELYIEIDVLARRLKLKDNEQIIKSYPIAVGRSKQFMTPPGNYQIEVKDANPGWVNPYNPKIKIPPGPKNPIGTRWIGFHGNTNKTQVYGIHGTNQPNSIGKFVSHGCIRMLTPDSEDLFNRVEVGTPVIVLYKRFEITHKEGDLILTLHEDPYNIEPLTIDNIKSVIKTKYPNAIINEIALKNFVQNPILEQARLIGYLNESISETN